MTAEKVDDGDETALSILFVSSANRFSVHVISLRATALGEPMETRTHTHTPERGPIHACLLVAPIHPYNYFNKIIAEILVP